MLRTRPLGALLARRPAQAAQARAAHVAAAPREDDEASEAGPSTAAAASRRSARDSTGGAKGSAAAADYSFPTQGRNGGPPDPYEVLGLERSASDKEVKQQYYRLALLLHPDSSHPSSSAANFSTLHRAYTLLSDPAKRSSYRQTGFGWSGSADGAAPTYDDMLRAEVRHRQRAGAAAWGHGRHGFREAEAGAQRPGWQPYDADGAYARAHDPNGKREERYMRNTSFMSVVMGVAAMIAYFQWLRLDSAAGTARGVLEQRHVVASHALAEARQEAAVHGKERRESIRRRVRENEVLREIERLEREGAGHTAVAVVPGAAGRRRAKEA